MNRYMRGMSNGGLVMARGAEPLTDAAIAAAVPSVFAAEAHESRSERYAYIPTGTVLEGLRREGFEPFYAQQSRTRIEGKQAFTKHMLRLRHRSRTDWEGEAHEIILVNAHDGESSYQMISGVFLSIGYHGSLDQLAGYIAKEDREAAEAVGIFRAAIHPARISKPERKGPFSAALSADLSEVRTGSLQTAVLDNPYLALDLITFALATPVYCDALPLGITTEDAPNAPKSDEGMRLPKALRALGERTMPLRADAAAEAFAAFQCKKPATKTMLLTAHVARRLRIGLAGGCVNPFAEMIADQAGLDVRRVWTPTESFLKRLTKDQLLAIHRHIMDRPGPSTSQAKQSKKDIAHWLHLIFNGGKYAPTLTDTQRARADCWLPEGMAAPAVRSVEAERDAA